MIILLIILYNSHYKSGNANYPISLLQQIMDWKRPEVWILTSDSQQVMSGEMKQPLEQCVPSRSGNGPVHIQIPVPSSDVNEDLHYFS